VKILICEDEPIMMLVLTAILKKLGYKVICSKDGKEAIDLINSESPDMVITDMLLPILSGTEIISYVNNLPGEKIPVILLSSMPVHILKDNEGDFPADGYLMKPVLPQQLKDKIEELKSIKRSITVHDISFSLQ